MTVSTLPAVQDEQYVTRRELAGLLGVHVATIDRLIAAGMPVLRLGRTVRIRPSVAVRWATEQNRDRAA